MKIKKNIQSKKAIISLLALLVIVCTAVTAYAFHNEKDNQFNDTPRAINSVDYSDPTQEESNAGNEQKEKNKEREAIDALPTSKNAAVTISDATQYNRVIETRAYVTGVYEDGGTCTATFTKSGSISKTISKSAFKDAKTLQCGALDITRDEFDDAGEWTVIVSYDSPTATGTSSARKIVLE